MNVNEPVWLRRSTVIGIHARQLSEHGGLFGIRDEGLLDAALARPMQLWSYESPTPELPRLGAAYAWSILRNHPFIDGNKRTAYVAMRSFFIRNGMDLAAAQEARYLIMLAAAAGEITEQQFTEWVTESTSAL